jgi:hypothetical protein
LAPLRRASRATTRRCAGHRTCADGQVLPIFG